MTGVRYGEMGFEGKCPECGQWWPLVPDCWYRSRNERQLRRCRACEGDRRNVERLSYLERRRIYNRNWMRAYRRRPKVAA